MDDRLEEMLAEGPSNDVEAYELEEYVQGHINYLDKRRRECMGDIEELQNRYRRLGKEMDTYRTRIKRVLPDFGG